MNHCWSKSKIIFIIDLCNCLNKIKKWENKRSQKENIPQVNLLQEKTNQAALNLHNRTEIDQRGTSTNKIKSASINQEKMKEDTINNNKDRIGNKKIDKIRDIHKGRNYQKDNKPFKIWGKNIIKVWNKIKSKLKKLNWKDNNKE